MKARRHLASLAIAILGFTAMVAAGAQPANSAAITFDFFALCDDCAGTGELFALNPENMNDNIYEEVSGSLTLFDYTPGDLLDSSYDFSFTYNGSSLIDPFTMSSATGGRIYDGPVRNQIERIFADGTIDGTFEIQFRSAEVGEADNFSLRDTGTWSIALARDPGEISEAADFGISGALSPISLPVPGAVAFLSVGLLSLGMRRRAA